MQRISIYKAQLVREKSHPFENVVVRSPKDAADVVVEFLRKEYGDGFPDREVFIGMWLNTKNKITGIEVVSIGTLNASLAHPREVFTGAILHKAASIILAHQHPSGDLSPSPEDKQLTERMCEAGTLLGIEVLDHVIVNDLGRFLSLKENGFM